MNGPYLFSNILCSKPSVPSTKSSNMQTQTITNQAYTQLTYGSTQVQVIWLVFQHIAQFYSQLIYSSHTTIDQSLQLIH